MRFALALALALTFGSHTALAGKGGKYSSFQSSYQFVINKVGRTSAKGKKATALMREVRKGFKTMSREAFYGLVAKKEPQLMALAN